MFLCYYSVAVCSLISEGVAAIFGPNSIRGSDIVASISNEFGIPNFVGHWQLSTPFYQLESHSYTRNLFPSSQHFSRALSDLLSDYGWTTFAILYEDNYSLMRLEDVLQMHTPNDSPLVVRQLPDDGDYKPLLKDLSAMGETRIILDCSSEKVLDVLNQAAAVKMLQEYQNYIITSLNAHTIDFMTLKYSRSNITTWRMYNPESVDVQTAILDWRQGEWRHAGQLDVATDKIFIESMLMHDAVRMFSMALREYTVFDEIAIEPGECESPSKWSHGEAILKIVDEVYDIRFSPFASIFDHRYSVVIVDWPLTQFENSIL